MAVVMVNGSEWGCCGAQRVGADARELRGSRGLSRLLWARARGGVLPRWRRDLEGQFGARAEGPVDVRAHVRLRAAELETEEVGVAARDAVVAIDIAASGGWHPGRRVVCAAVTFDARGTTGRVTMTEETHQTATGGLDDFEAALRPLWERARNGHDAAYKEALGRISERLRGWLRRRMQTLPDDVEDLVQETLLAIHLQRGT